MTQIKYPNIFSPLRVNSMMLSNRIIASPMGTPKLILLSSTNYGGVSVADRAKGGAGGICLNILEVAEAGKAKDPWQKYAKDATREILSVTRQAGAKSILEIFFHTMMPRDDGTFMMPCDGLDFRNKPARAMSKEEIQAKIDEVVQNAIEAKNFGFDAIMLHMGHDALTSLFLSPVWNQRDDEYGGSLENRIRISKELTSKVRKAVGKDFPILVRLSRQLMVRESYSENDMMELIKTIEEDIDMVNISTGMDEYGGEIEKYTANIHAMTTNFEPHNYSVEFAERIKKETNLLVAPVGAIMSVQEAEKIIASKKADAVFMARALVADPYLPKKAMEGKEDDIVPCVRCGHCYHITTNHTNSVCSVNPRFRREDRVPLKLEKTNKSKKVVVIGAGPAGIKAALTAEEKGHHVILIEKSDKLAGQINVSDYDDYKQDLRRYRDYLLKQVKKSNLDVRMNTMATKEYVTSLNPDVIIIAIGASQIIPKIEGIENGISALDIYPHLNEIHSKKIAIVGGGTIGSELALELGERGNEIQIVDMAKDIVLKGNSTYRISLKEHLAKVKKVNYYLESAVKKINKDSVEIMTKDGKREKIEADLVIVAVGMKPNKEEAYDFYGITPRTYMIGDCNQVGKIIEATNEGYFISANIE
jgi:2,4-dienoyl-CoA reductase-like NADH-dependent reductase (Old Yellow Enzyme family)/thioredoxin reductase